MTRLTLLLCLFGLAWSQVSAALDSEGIVGGGYAEEGQFKYQISLQVDGEGMCGGCIIADQYILTAAHCVKDANGEFRKFPFRVLAGTNNLNDTKTAVEVPVETIFVHSHYDPLDILHDIAVLKLKKGLGLGSNPKIQKVNLPQADNTYASVTAVISGFGLQNMDVAKSDDGKWKELGGKRDGKLKYASVNVLSHDECVKKNSPQPIHETNICGQILQSIHIGNPELYDGVCSGDSGGPLVYGDAVIGIVSYGPFACDESARATAYTRVSDYLNLIQSVIKGTPSNEVVSAQVTS